MDGSHVAQVALNLTAAENGVEPQLLLSAEITETQYCS